MKILPDPCSRSPQGLYRDRGVISNTSPLKYHQQSGTVSSLSQQPQAPRVLRGLPPKQFDEAGHALALLSRRPLKTTLPAYKALSTFAAFLLPR